MPTRPSRAIRHATADQKLDAILERLETLADLVDRTHAHMELQAQKAIIKESVSQSKAPHKHSEEEQRKQVAENEADTKESAVNAVRA